MVTVVKKGEFFTYKATPSRKPSASEVILLKWATKNDNGKVKELTGVSSHNQLSKEGKIIIGIAINEDCEKAKVYAYFKKASEKVSVEVKIKNPLPVYIDRFKIKGLDRQGKNIADDLCYGVGVTNQYPSRYTIADIESKGMWIKGEIRDKTNDELWTGFIRMVKSLFSVGELETVALDMVEQFKQSHGNEYSNSILTKHVKAHPSTQRFCLSIEDEIADRLNKSKGDISNIEDAIIHFTDNEIGKFGKRGWGHPQFSALKDTFYGGLTICMNDTWSYEIKLIKYKKVDDGNYEATYKVALYDHFGLDMPDIEKKYYYLPGFRYWFILQHIRGFKPFITKVEFEKTFKESISVGKTQREKKRREAKEKEDRLNNIGRKKPGEI